MTVVKHSGQPGNVLALDDRGAREIVALSTGSTAFTLSTGDSGKMLIIGAYTSGVTITLPTMEDGLNYELYCGGAPTSGVYTISAATAGDLVVYGDAAANSILFGKAGAASGTNIGGGLRLVTDGSKWYSIMLPAFTSAAPTSATMTTYAIVT